MSGLVFVHAFGTSGRAWTPQVVALSERYRVLAPDLPGHGDAEGPFTLRRAVESVRVAIDEVGGRAYVVGISGGAVVALLACLEHPTHVVCLVLSAGCSPSAIVRRAEALTRLTPESVLVRGLAGMYSGGRAEHRRAAADDFRVSRHGCGSMGTGDGALSRGFER